MGTFNSLTSDNHGLLNHSAVNHGKENWFCYLNINKCSTNFTRQIEMRKFRNETLRSFERGKFRGNNLSL